MESAEFEPAAPLRAEDWITSSSTAQELAPHVHRLPLLRSSTCNELLREIEGRAASLRARGVDFQPPNSMHVHGYVL